MPVTPPRCRVCGKPHWIRDGCGPLDPALLAVPRTCNNCGTVHEKWKQCPPEPVTLIGVDRGAAGGDMYVQATAHAGKLHVHREMRVVPARNELSSEEVSSARPTEDRDVQPERRLSGTTPPGLIRERKTAGKTFDKRSWQREYMREYRRGERRMQRPTKETT